MALTYAQLDATTRKKYLPVLQDNIFDSDILLKRAKEKGWYEAVDGGTDINVPLIYAVTSAGGAYAPSDTLDTTDNDQMTLARHTWPLAA